jgi:FkbM family methyltransferase
VKRWFGKASVLARIVSDAQLWRIAAKELLGSKRSRDEPLGPEIAAVEGDDGSGLRAVDVSGSRYWQPATMNLQALGPIHGEVFGADHPHYYEYQGCSIKPGDVVVDAGASEGFFTRFALDRGARVIAVEPWSVQARALRRTYAGEIAQGRVVVEQVALGDSDGEVTLELDPSAPWGATVGQAYRGSVREVVPRTTLDHLVDRTWGRCDFLKADVEGAEAQLVEGARQTLARDRPRIAIAVYHGPTNYLDVRATLRSLGAGYHVTGKGLYRRRFLYLPMLLHAWTTANVSGSWNS